MVDITKEEDRDNARKKKKHINNVNQNKMALREKLEPSE